MDDKGPPRRQSGRRPNTASRTPYQQPAAPDSLELAALRLACEVINAEDKRLADWKERRGHLIVAFLDSGLSAPELMRATGLSESMIRSALRRRTTPAPQGDST
jgi:hypothetical protein